MPETLIAQSTECPKVIFSRFCLRSCLHCYIHGYDVILEDIPEDFVPVAEYFEVTYIRGKPARGRRRAVAVRYAPEIWNHYYSVLNGSDRTNNSSEGWHNRFQTLMGRYHLSFYAFVSELQQEQAATEVKLEQISMGQKVKKIPTSNYLKYRQKIFYTVSQYDEYVSEDNVLEYLKKLCYHLYL